MSATQAANETTQKFTDNHESQSWWFHRDPGQKYVLFNRELRSVETPDKNHVFFIVCEQLIHFTWLCHFMCFYDSDITPKLPRGVYKLIETRWLPVPPKRVMSLLFAEWQIYPPPPLLHPLALWSSSPHGQGNAKESAPQGSARSTSGCGMQVFPTRSTSTHKPWENMCQAPAQQTGIHWGRLSLNQSGRSVRGDFIQTLSRTTVLEDVFRSSKVWNQHNVWF